MWVAALDAKQKLVEIAAQVLGGAPGDYDLGNEKVVSKADPSKSITYAQAAQKAVELGGKFSGKEAPRDINPVTGHGPGMIPGSGPLGAPKHNLPRVRLTPGFPTPFVARQGAAATGKLNIVHLLGV